MAAIQIHSYRLVQTQEWGLYAITENAEVRRTPEGKIQARLIDPSRSGGVYGDFWDEQQEVWSEDWYDIGFFPDP